MPWFYISFANNKRFLGGCVVEAQDAVRAAVVAENRGLVPKDSDLEYIVIESPDDTPGPYEPYKLLTREELGEGATMGEMLKAGLSPPDEMLVGHFAIVIEDSP